MFRVLICTGAVRLLVTLAFFAGLSAQIPAFAQSPSSPSNWTGLSLGGGIGASISLTDMSLDGSRNGEIGLCNPANCGPTFFSLGGLTQSQAFDFENLGEASFMGTAQLGFDYQVGSNFVVGAFADIEFSTGDEADFNSSTTTNLSILGGAFNVPLSTITGTGTVEHDYSFSVGGRIGFLATAQTLFYGLGAYTQVELEKAEFQFTVTDPLGFIPPINSPTNLTVNMPDNLQGFTVGGGVETKLSDTLSMKFEYRYSDLEGEARTASNSTIQCCLFIAARRIQEDVRATLDMETHTVRAALSWKPNFNN